MPGVSAFGAAAAAAGRELTIPEVAQSVVLTRLEGGKTPMPERERLREFARHRTTMAIFLSAARTAQLVTELLAGGYPPDTPVVIAYRTSWPDELTVRCRLDELEAECKERKLWRQTLFLVGPALGAAGTRSHLYHAGHFHTFRKPDPAARRALRASRPVHMTPPPPVTPTPLDPALRSHTAVFGRPELHVWLRSAVGWSWSGSRGGRVAAGGRGRVGGGRGGAGGAAASGGRAAAGRGGAGRAGGGRAGAGPAGRAPGRGAGQRGPRVLRDRPAAARARAPPDRAAGPVQRGHRCSPGSAGPGTTWRWSARTAGRSGPR